MTNTTRLPGLDGIRAIAILMVITVHYYTGPIYAIEGGFVEPGSFWAYAERLTRYFWTGVDLFFVLSGFLITRILLANIGASNLIQTFYIRRSLRIFPAYFFFIFVFWGFFHLGCAWNCDPQQLPPLWPCVVYVQNFYYWIIGSKALTPLVPLWSLAVEEQFYLVLPALVLLLRSRLTPYLFMVSIIAPVVLRYVVTDFSGTVTPFRLDGLAYGGFLACYVHKYGFPKVPYNVVVLTLIILLGLFFSITWTYYNGKNIQFVLPVICSIGVVLIQIAVVNYNRFPGRFLDTRLLTWIGQRSYFVYLWHMLILYVFFGSFERKLGSMVSAIDVYLTIASFMATFLMAEISWKLFEHPLIRLGHRYKYNNA